MTTPKDFALACQWHFTHEIIYIRSIFNSFVGSGAPFVGSGAPFVGAALHLWASVSEYYFYFSNPIVSGHEYVIISLFDRKPKTQAGRRALEAREPKIIENTKQTMIIKGAKTGETVNEALKDIVSVTVATLRLSLYVDFFSLYVCLNLAN